MTLDRDFETYMQRVLDMGHRSRPGADTPPADTWQRVIAQVQPQPEEKSEMNAMTLPASIAQEHPVPRIVRRGVGHYISLAATIAIVAAVAMAGWFATMQLNQPDGRFALFGQTDEAAVCDVEPMTVDEAMSVAKNPLGFMAPDAEFMAKEEFLMFGVLTANEGTVPGFVPPHRMVTDVQLEPVSDDDFSAATDVGQEFLNCLAQGTFGQAWQFVDPVTLHYELHSAFPMFTSEDEARDILADLIASPAAGMWDGGYINPIQDEGFVQINPTRE